MNRFRLLFVFLFFFILGCQKDNSLDLVDIAALDSTIVIDLKYAQEDNFLGRAVYPDTQKAYLRRFAAEQLVQVQSDLRQKGYGLKVWDAYRPVKVQEQMWEILPDSRYVANPATGSRHNRGAAVDVTLVDLHGRELPMPTAFDDFSEQAAADYADLPPELIKNRALLQQAMTGNGFTTIDSEWWHFDAIGWERCEIIRNQTDSE